MFNGLPWWFHWVVCSLLCSVFWLVVLIIGVAAVGTPRKREREREKYIKELEQHLDERDRAA